MINEAMFDINTGLLREMQLKKQTNQGLPATRGKNIGRERLRLPIAVGSTWIQGLRCGR